VQEECVIAAPAALRPVTAVRSTLLQSSLGSLRNRGHFDRYLTLVDPRYREVILGSLAPEWLPLGAALAHYDACQRLELSNQELMELGEDVGARIQGTFIGTIVRKARTIGLTPWVPLAQFQRLYERLMQGGGVALYRTAPKDCRIEVFELPLARFPYFRSAFCGVIASGIKLGSGRAVTVRQASDRNVESRLIFRASWV
jgi:hypothetical protein